MPQWSTCYNHSEAMAGSCEAAGEDGTVEDGTVSYGTPVATAASTAVLLTVAAGALGFLFT